MNRKKWALLGLAVLAMVTAAYALGARSPSEPSITHAVLPGDENVLAEVNGSQITRYDLERTIAETLNEEAIHQLDEEGRQRALQSIVASRAIARAREAELDAAGREAIDRKAARYRDQLLVRQYLDAHAPPEPVTPEMVSAYYEAHPESFGGSTRRTYEMLFTTRSLTAAERDTLSHQLRDPAQHSDWRAWAATLTAQGLPVNHRRGDASASALDARVRRVLGRLRLGQTSTIVYVDGRAFLMRIAEEEQRPRRPLAEVREQIRQRLAPRQLRDAVRAARTSVLQHAEVVYR
ncbi:MAG: peptidyl-prolyl cis-trans isomerase [Deltaproteobacteria bacterium]|nr:peptidyl-prolyl cis-trans isomerase [Deltaproteobacteria bacterium]